MSNRNERHSDEIDEKLREIEWQIEREEEERIRREEEEENELDHPIYPTRKEKKGGPRYRADPVYPPDRWPLTVKQMIKFGKLGLFVICGSGRRSGHPPQLPFRTVHETFTSHGSYDLCAGNPPL